MRTLHDGKNCWMVITCAWHVFTKLTGTARAVAAIAAFSSSDKPSAFQDRWSSAYALALSTRGIEARAVIRSRISHIQGLRFRERTHHPQRREAWRCRAFA